jgi:hypothetical protein
MRTISPVLKILFALAAVIFIYLRVSSFIESRSVLPQVRGFINRFYAEYNARDFGYIYDKLSYPKFKTNISRPDFEKLMGIVYANLGKAKGARMAGWKIRRAKGQFYCDIHYRITHDNTESKEDFTLIRSQGVLFLSSYHINSKNLILKK